MELSVFSVTTMAEYPKITVVTPSYNQGPFLERTIRSVLDQGYPNLEYIIVDGGSTDDSVEIIRRYESRLAYWVSERDSGQVDAINKGLRRATGDWVAWQNSDDIFFPGTFADVAAAVAKRPDADLVIGDMMLIDEHDRPLRDIRYVTPSHKALLAEGMLLANQAAFWRRSLHDRIGLIDTRWSCSFDYDWFLRITEQGVGIHVNRIWGALRLHGATKTSNQALRFAEENAQILAGRELPTWQRKWFMLRRMALMLGRGQFAYVLRGLARRAVGASGGYA